MAKQSKPSATFEIQEELKNFITDKKAEKLATHINFEAIRQLRSQGKSVKAALMKNNLVAFVIQSPLWQFYEKDEIDSKLFAAGQQYSRDYFLSIKDNMAKQTYDGSFVISSSPSNKEPSHKQIEAYRRLEEVKRELNRRSHYLIPKQKTHNKRYVQILELFLEQEKGIVEIMEVFKMRHGGVKQRIIEALEISVKIYQKIL